jgi:hypothetical protein
MTIYVLKEKPYGKTCGYYRDEPDWEIKGYTTTYVKAQRWEYSSDSKHERDFEEVKEIII